MALIPRLWPLVAKTAATTAAIATLAACSGIAATQVDTSSGECMFGANGADVQVGIATPSSSCSSWIKALAGDGLVWYPISQMTVPGSQGTADGDMVAEVCDLTDGTQELYVQDGGSAFYGNGICNQEEQNGWTPEGTPGPLASDAQQAQQQQEQAQASASAAASQAAAHQQQEQNAQDDVSTLTQDTDFSGDVSSLTSDVQSEDSDLASERSDAANGNGDQCINASTTVYNDAATTVYNDDLTTVYNDSLTIANDISGVRKDISTVQADQAALQSNGLPATPGASAAISAAQAAITSAISTANADIDHANADLDAAYQIANSVGTGSCAGDGPGTPPAGVSHLK
jgi:hypothetical protein